jgi:hypothetical protein
MSGSWTDEAVPQRVHVAAQQWLARYVRLIDTGRFDELGTLVADQVRLRRADGAESVGREAFVEWFRAAAPSFRFIRHMVTDVLLQPDDGPADQADDGGGRRYRMDASFLAVVITASGSRLTVGDYVDLVLDDGRRLVLLGKEIRVACTLPLTAEAVA